MKSKSLLWQFYPYLVLIVIISLVALAWYSTNVVRHLYLDGTAQDLQARSLLIGKLITEDLKRGDYESIEAFCDSLGPELASRITIILPSGQVIGDSEEDPGRMDNHADRPEIKRALDGEIGISTRYSYTLSKKMMYLAVPLRLNGGTACVIRSSLPVMELTQKLKDIYKQIAFIGLIIAVGAALVSLFLYYRIKKPIDELQQTALRFGAGDLNHRLYIENPEEFRTLALSMNQMASQLNDRLHTITEQHTELESILSSMMEGMIVIDKDENIIRFNRTAGHLFDMEPVLAQGKSIQEVIRNIDLLRFIRKTLQGGKTDETEIVLHEKKDRFLQAHGTVLSDESGDKNGALIVLNDITHLKRLENIRKDFVANVSHEIKTPLTAIKGSVETLKAGAIRDKADALRFLEIIGKHAERLNTLTEDLLNLSRIEQEAERHEIAFSVESLKSVLSDAVSVCRNKADEKGITIDVICDDDLTARMNAHLIEEAVINLVDNAIKYSEPKKHVRVEAYAKDASTLIRVIDEGCGIPEEHQSRLFERFYRVDKARSRNLGGTGLGLAIVKHIVQAHSGEVYLETSPGEGSVFTITLPG